jgi:hypothetical protein
MKNFANVELVKFPELDEVDESMLETTITNFLKKVGEDVKLHLSLKQYKRGGLRMQHEVHARALFGGRGFFASYEGWMLLDAVQRVLKKVEKEVDKAFSKEE